jgi:hypothetical protein
MSEMFIALKVTPKPKTNPFVELVMPKGCKGICFVFFEHRSRRRIYG